MTSELKLDRWEEERLTKAEGFVRSGPECSRCCVHPGLPLVKVCQGCFDQLTGDDKVVKKAELDQLAWTHNMLQQYLDLDEFGEAWWISGHIKIIMRRIAERARALCPRE
jgi:hypothetical protein